MTSVSVVAILVVRPTAVAVTRVDGADAEEYLIFDGVMSIGLMD